MNNDLISREAAKEKYRSLLKTAKELGIDVSPNFLDFIPTVDLKLSDEQIEKIADLLETEWGYKGIREDVSRILREDGQ